jgi:hypothetical protein
MIAERPTGVPGITPEPPSYSSTRAASQGGITTNQPRQSISIPRRVALVLKHRCPQLLVVSWSLEKQLPSCFSFFESTPRPRFVLSLPVPWFCCASPRASLTILPPLPLALTRERKPRDPQMQRGRLVLEASGSTTPLCCAAVPGVLPRSCFCLLLLSSESARERTLSCGHRRWCGSLPSGRGHERALPCVSPPVGVGCACYIVFVSARAPIWCVVVSVRWLIAGSLRRWPSTSVLRLARVYCHCLTWLRPLF